MDATVVEKQNIPGLPLTGEFANGWRTAYTIRRPASVPRTKSRTRSPQTPAIRMLENPLRGVTLEGDLNQPAEFRLGRDGAERQQRLHLA